LAKPSLSEDLRPLARGFVGLLAPRAFGIERGNLLLNGVDWPPAPLLLLAPLHACFPRRPAQRLYRRLVHAARLMLLLLLDIETTGFSRRRHEITVMGTILYDRWRARSASTAA